MSLIRRVLVCRWHTPIQHLTEYPPASQTWRQWLKKTTFLSSNFCKKKFLLGTGSRDKISSLSEVSGMTWGDKFEIANRKLEAEDHFVGTPEVKCFSTDWNESNAYCSNSSFFRIWDTVTAVDDQFVEIRLANVLLCLNTTFIVLNSNKLKWLEKQPENLLSSPKNSHDKGVPFLRHPKMAAQGSSTGRAHWLRQWSFIVYLRNTYLKQVNLFKRLNVTCTCLSTCQSKPEGRELIWNNGFPARPKFNFQLLSLSLNCVVLHCTVLLSMQNTSFNFTSVELDCDSVVGGTTMLPTVPTRFLDKSLRCSEFISLLSKADAQFVAASAIFFYKQDKPEV